MNYATIKRNDIANGLGVRVSLFVSGCTHHCEGCFNEVAWDFGYGDKYTSDTEQLILDYLAPSYVQGLSLLGGEPMEIENQKVLVHLLKVVKEVYPTKDVWCYTGYVLDDLLEGGRVHTEVTDQMLSYIDVLVDGPFVLSLKDIRLKFRGSSNQRILDMKSTLAQGKPVLIEQFK